MELILVLHNIRSTYNVGAILRTAEGFGVGKVIYAGFTPSPLEKLPHIAEKNARQIAKTALGAEKTLPSSKSQDILADLTELKQDGYKILGLENNLKDPRLVQIKNAELGSALPKKAVLILGEEVAGISAELYPLIDNFLEIPMRGQKESFNVSVATGIALFWLLGR